MTEKDTLGNHIKDVDLDTETYILFVKVDDEPPRMKTAINGDQDELVAMLALGLSKFPVDMKIGIAATLVGSIEIEDEEPAQADDPNAELRKQLLGEG